MSEYDKLRAAIQKRANTNDEWDNAVHLCWEEMVTVFSEDMSKTICFLKNDCIVIHLPCTEQYSKSGDGKPSVGSNPTASAFAIRLMPYGFFIGNFIVISSHHTQSIVSMYVTREKPAKA